MPDLSLATETDPVAAEWVASLAKPGGNVTGVASNAGAGLFSKYPSAACSLRL